MNPASYSLWFMVILNSVIFIMFAFSFTKPKTKRDWRSFGAFSAFIVALFTEMYGFPLTIYLLSGWLVKRVPGIDIYSHDSGHLWETIFNLGGDPHLNILHVLSYIAIGGGFILLAKAWNVLYKAQKDHRAALTGPYARIIHPQYVGFVLIMFGFLLQWPTLITLVMFPILIAMYVHLAKTEEKEMIKEFGEPYKCYLAQLPRFIPDRRKFVDHHHEI